MMYSYVGQQCLRTNHASGMLPALRDYSNSMITYSNIHHWNQVIIPSYRFQCHGNITEWGIDIFQRNNNRRNRRNRYNLDLQVWRPSPTVDTDGCYSLVGNNRFSSVALNSGIARVTPLPEHRIEFQSGDVVGFYVESFSRFSGGVTTLNDFEQRGDRGFETEVVWYGYYHRAVSQGSQCPYPLGPNGVLNRFTNAAPVISVSISE